MTTIKTEWLLLCVVVVVTLAASLFVLRWLAPQLIGLPMDLRLVQTAKKLPPFYEGVFRRADYSTRNLLLSDPITVTRGRPRFPEVGGLGPHDVLGFRNRNVPVYADLTVIGDSQTYGNNVALEDNWPSQMTELLDEYRAVTYSMASGGWGAVQYLEMATKATTFQPRLLIVAFYTGNDSLESFRLAYQLDEFEDLRPTPELGPEDMPQVSFPTPPEELWPVTFKDGFETVFAPALRLPANEDHPVVRAGYGVMLNAAREIRRITAPFNTRVIFTVIPTKEYVFAEKVRGDGISPPSKFERLVAEESQRISEFADALASVPDSEYVDVAQPLIAAANAGRALFPSNENGHPIEDGYAVIAETLAAAARGKLLRQLLGPVLVPIPENKELLFLVQPDGVWSVRRMEDVLNNGWSRDQLQIASFRDLTGLPRRGTLDGIDPLRFGPQAPR